MIIPESGLIFWATLYVVLSFRRSTRQQTNNIEFFGWISYDAPPLVCLRRERDFSVQIDSVELSNVLEAKSKSTKLLILFYGKLYVIHVNRMKQP